MPHFIQTRPNRILTVELHRRFLYYPFFQEKTLGDISFKLETKIMNFMTGFFFRKKYNQVNSSVVNNMQYNLFTIFPLSGPFVEFGILSVILTKYHYIILLITPDPISYIYFLNYINYNEFT